MFSLASLFNGISTFEGYFMQKPSLKKESYGTIQPIAGQGVHIFSKGISPKVNVIGWLKSDVFYQATNMKNIFSHNALSHLSPKYT